MKILPLTHEARQEIENKFLRIQDQLTSSQRKLTDKEKKEYIKQLKTMQKTVFIQRPLVSSNQQNQWFNMRIRKRDQEKYVANLQSLLDSGVEIQFLPINPIKNLMVVLLVDYGPVYPADISADAVINRMSRLDIYPTLKRINRLVRIDENGKLMIQNYLPRFHPQTFEISQSTYNQLFEQFSWDLYSLTSFNQLKSFAKLAMKPQKNHIFSVPYNAPASDSLLHQDFTRKVYCSLKLGKSLIVISNEASFKEFLMAYDPSITAQTDKRKTKTSKIILLSQEKYEGYSQIEFKSIRLDMMDFRQNYQLPIAVFQAIDTLLGHKYISTLSDFNKALNDIEEFNSSILGKTQTYEQFIEIIKRQLTQDAMLSDKSNVPVIYQLLRMFRHAYILNPKTIEQGKLRNTIPEFPTYGIIDTNTLSKEEATIFLVLLIYKIAESNFIEPEERVFDYTFVIDDKRILRLLQQSEINKQLVSILEKQNKIRFIIHATNENQLYSFEKIPTLQLRKRKENRYINEMRVGNSIRLEVI